MNDDASISSSQVAPDDSREPRSNRVAPGQQDIVEPPNSSLAELKSAIAACRVTAEQLATAQRLTHDADLPDFLRTEYAKLLVQLEDTYCRSSTPTFIIADRFFCRHLTGGVILGSYRSDYAIDLVYLPDARGVPDALDRAIWEVRGAYTESRQCGRARQSALARTIFGILSSLLSQADQIADSRQLYEKQVASLDGPGAIVGAPFQDEDDEELSRRAAAESQKATMAVDRALQAEALQRYFLGMMLGVVLLGAVVAFASRFINSEFSLMLPVAVAGGAGALISAMTRLSRSDLKVDYTAGNLLLILNGSFRPIIGGVFGLALFVFIEGNLLPINVKAVGSAKTLFYLGVAFIAGFSERFAQDAITKAGAVLDASNLQGAVRK